VSGVIKQHVLANDGALDRRRLEELFFEAAKRVTEISGINIGNNQFGRENFHLTSFEEYDTNFEVETSYINPLHSHQLPGTDLLVSNDDSFYEAEMAWSIHAIAEGDSSQILMGWPVVDGKALWSAEDWSQYGRELVGNGDPLSNPFDDSIAGAGFDEDDLVCLGNTCNLVGQNGHSFLGVLLFSIGQFRVTKSQVTFRKLAR